MWNTCVPTENDHYTGAAVIKDPIVPNSQDVSAVKVLRQDLCRARNEASRLRRQIRTALRRKLTIDEILNACRRYDLHKNGQELLRVQLQSSTKTKARWSVYVRQFAMALYKANPMAHRMLSRLVRLPSKASIHRWLANGASIGSITDFYNDQGSKLEHGDVRTEHPVEIQGVREQQLGASEDTSYIQLDDVQVYELSCGDGTDHVNSQNQISDVYLSHEDEQQYVIQVVNKCESK